jgi:aminopeptidase N
VKVFHLVLEEETSANRAKVQVEVVDKWRQTPDMLTKYIGIVSNLESSDAGKQILALLANPIGKVNQMSAYPVLQSFDHLDRFDEETKAKMVARLQKMQDSIDKKKEESLYNQLNIILKKV